MQIIQTIEKDGATARKFLRLVLTPSGEHLAQYGIKTNRGCSVLNRVKTTPEKFAKIAAQFAKDAQ